MTVLTTLTIRNTDNGETRTITVPTADMANVIRTCHERGYSIVR